MNMNIIRKEYSWIYSNIRIFATLCDDELFSIREGFDDDDDDHELIEALEKFVDDEIV